MSREGKAIRRAILDGNDEYQFGDPDDDETGFTVVAIIEMPSEWPMSDDGVLLVAGELFTAECVLNGINTQGFPLPDSARVVWRAPG